MKPRSLFPLALSLAALTCFAQQRDFSQVKINVIPVAKNIYMLEGSGGNIGVSVGPDGILIVDDQFAPLAEKIEAALRTLDAGKLKFVLNTHHHGDHTGGNANFGAKGATIIAQSNVRKRLASDANSKKEALPVITFDQSASVHFNGEEIKLLHHGPGHTDGDSVIYFTGANVVHMGDQFFNGAFPFIDLNSGGSVEGYIKTVAAVLEKIRSLWIFFRNSGDIGLPAICSSTYLRVSSSPPKCCCQPCTSTHAKQPPMNNQNSRSRSSFASANSPR